MRHHRIHNILLAFGVAFIFSCSISGPLREDKKAERYKLGTLGSEWKKVELESGADSVFLNKKTNSLLSINSVCDRYEDSSLKSLTKELLTPIKQHKIESAKEFKITQRLARHTVASGHLDGVPIQTEIVVLRKNRCLFDFSIYAKKLSKAERAAFLKFVQAFEFQESQ